MVKFISEENWLLHSCDHIIQPHIFDAISMSHVPLPLDNNEDQKKLCHYNSLDFALEQCNLLRSKLLWKKWIVCAKSYAVNTDKSNKVCRICALCAGFDGSHRYTTIGLILNTSPHHSKSQQQWKKLEAQSTFNRSIVFVEILLSKSIQ